MFNQQSYKTEQKYSRSFFLICRIFGSTCSDLLFEASLLIGRFTSFITLNHKVHTKLCKENLFSNARGACGRTVQYPPWHLHDTTESGHAFEFFFEAS